MSRRLRLGAQVLAMPGTGPTPPDGVSSLGIIVGFDDQNVVVYFRELHERYSLPPESVSTVWDAAASAHNSATCLIKDTIRKHAAAAEKASDTLEQQLHSAVVLALGLLLVDHERGAE